MLNLALGISVFYYLLKIFKDKYIIYKKELVGKRQMQKRISKDGFTLKKFNKKIDNKLPAI